MARPKPPTLQVKAFADHHVITQPNPLRGVMRYVEDKDLDTANRVLAWLDQRMLAQREKAR